MPARSWTSNLTRVPFCVRSVPLSMVRLPPLAAIIESALKTGRATAPKSAAIHACGAHMSCAAACSGGEIDGEHHDIAVVREREALNGLGVVQGEGVAIEVHRPGAGRAGRRD